jgi:allantoin racemase
MKLTVVSPLIGEDFAEHVRREVAQWVSPELVIDVVKVQRGVVSIESEYDEALAGPGILEAVQQAAADGADAVFITCFGDPAVHAAREVVDIPVVGGFEPAMLTALSLGDHVGIVTVLPNVVPMINGLVRRYGLSSRCTDVRIVDLPVLSLDEPDKLLALLHREATAAIESGNVDVIVLGCTGMIGVARELQTRLESDGTFVPVVDPTGTALLWLEKLTRLGLRASRATYLPPPPKERRP